MAVAAAPIPHPACSKEAADHPGHAQNHEPKAYEREYPSPGDTGSHSVIHSQPIFLPATALMTIRLYDDERPVNVTKAAIVYTVCNVFPVEGVLGSRQAF